MGFVRKWCWLSIVTNYAKLLFSVVAIMVVFSGCGYFNSGTWESDRKNWIRAFNESQPRDIEVVNSRYMKTPHWSYEFEYFFHIKGSEAAKKRLIEVPNLKRYAVTDELFMRVDSFFQEKPVWFLPRELECYDIWILSDEPRGNFRVFEDRESGDLYITDNQI